jgi:hypothetical protein
MLLSQNKSKERRGESPAFFSLCLCVKNNLPNHKNVVQYNR